MKKGLIFIMFLVALPVLIFLVNTLVMWGLVFDGPKEEVALGVKIYCTYTSSQFAATWMPELQVYKSRIAVAWSVDSHAKATKITAPFLQTLSCESADLMYKNDFVYKKDSVHITPTRHVIYITFTPSWRVYFAYWIILLAVGRAYYQVWPSVQEEKTD